MRGRNVAEEGAIPFVVVGVAALGGVLGAAWAGHEWSQALLGQAGGELTVWVLRGAFWALNLVALQASTTPVEADWYTPVLEGPALPIYALAALVMVATLIAETLAGALTGNTTRIVQAVIRALIAGMLATAGATLLLAIGGALSDLGRIALEAAGTTVDAPLVPLQEVLMDTAQQHEAGAELFIAFLAGLVIVFTSLAIYFTLAMRPVLLAAIIVFLPVAHALSVWTPMRRVELRAWALAFTVLLAEAAILTMFAVTNTVMGQPEGVDRLIFGTFGLLLAALAPAALARVIGLPELQTAVQSMSRGSRMAAVGAGAMALKGALVAGGISAGRGGNSGAAGSAGMGALQPGGGGLGGGSASAGGSGPPDGGSDTPAGGGGAPASGGSAGGAAAAPATSGAATGGAGASSHGPDAGNGGPSTTSSARAAAGGPSGRRPASRGATAAGWRSALHGRAGGGGQR